MHFAYLPPWWLILVIALAVAAAVFVAYRRPLSPLSTRQRTILVTLRTATLIAIVLLIFRPIVRLPPAGARDIVVPVLVDISRSMRIADADGQARIARAAALLQFDVLPALSQQYRTELLTLGEAVEPGSIESLTARGRRSDISGALARVRERFRGQRVAGVVVVSDGADTGAPSAVQRPGDGGGWPVFAIGVGATDGLRDREVLGIVAGDQRLDHASVDLQVSAASKRS